LKEPRAEALRWLQQAENDLAYARLGLREGFNAQVCFQCQQICEKAIKSIHYGLLARRVVYGHSLVELAGPLDLDDALRRELAILDQYYIPTRYPNGLPGGLPFEVYTADQAAAAVATCGRVIDLARQRLPAE
jgi:HEPN domain-containing protein